MPSSDQMPTAERGETATFATTHWSVVLAARKPDEPEGVAALEILCRTYWYPLYAFLRRGGHNPADAQDLTQEYFARLLQQNYPAQADRAKGRFRSFLLLTLKHFLSDRSEKASAQKRGGGERNFISLDGLPAEDHYCREPADQSNPEKIFERHWAQTVLDQALKRLRAEFRTGGNMQAYEVLKAFEPGEQPQLSYAEAAARLNISESAVKSLIHRLRQRHRELVREQIAHTVSTAAEIDEELRHLIAVISQ